MISLNSLKDIAIKKRSIVAIANAAELNILLVVKEALRNSYCSFILFDSEDKISTLAKEINLDLTQDDLDIVHCVTKPEHAAVKTIYEGNAQILMKGGLSTKSLLKAVLNKEYGLRSERILSHVALFEIPNQNQLTFLTDAAMNINPSLKEKADIIQNAVIVARSVGIETPKVAALAPVEVVNEAMTSTMDAAILTQMSNRNQIKNCTVDGPLAFDIAVSSEALKQKNVESTVNGEADILLAPNLEVGNALYKSFVYFANANVASVISGATAPIILTSRADSSENKMYSLFLALSAASK